MGRACGLLLHSGVAVTKRARQKFERKARDFYATPYEAVVPLSPHLPPRTWFWEPCAGDGALVNHICAFDHCCSLMSDICPQNPDIETIDALEFDATYEVFDLIITNPPWGRAILHPLIVHLSDIAPTWLLFDADWMHTKQSIPFLPRLRKIVSVGRVSWMGNGVSGFDNCAWYLFDQPSNSEPAFCGRAE